MKRGWYVRCSECGADVFLSRWRFVASLRFHRINQGAFNFNLCTTPLTLIWKGRSPVPCEVYARAEARIAELESQLRAAQDTFRHAANEDAQRADIIERYAAQAKEQARRIAELEMCLAAALEPVSNKELFEEVCKTLGRAETNGDSFGVTAARLINFIAARAQRVAGKGGDSAG